MPGEETILARRQRLSQVPRACEGCKIRKIRCDRTYPCSNCRASAIACQQAVPVPTPRPEIRPKGDRVEQLEEHVATLEARLVKLEHRLGSAEPGPAPPVKEQPRPSSSVSPSASSERHLHDVGPSDVGGLFEGSSSFLDQSVQASQLAQRKATTSGGTPEAAQTISESFSHLETLLHPGTALKGQQPSAGVEASAHATSGISPLPVGCVIAVLRRIKSHPSMFLSGYAIVDVPLVEHICQRVYFPTEPASIGYITSANGLLYLLLREYDMLQQSLGPEWDIKQLLAQAERNFDLGISSFDLLTVPSFESVLALTIGVIKCQTDTKPVLCRALLASACSHCQMLGYHRETTHQKDQSGFSEIKRRLFWMLYVYEKSASLLLGHASKVQDLDIDARHPTPSLDPAQRPWDQLGGLAIRLAKIQGQTYDNLYSAAALTAQPAERKRWIYALSAEAYSWRADFDRWDGSKVHYPGIVELSRTHWDITYYSTLTSLLRAPEMPGVTTDISAECFQAARQSLQCHLRCFSGYGGDHWASRSEYINWALHNSSFTPFVVIFLHSIAANSIEDVQLLEQVVDTLLVARDTAVTTDKSERLHQICATFARLARRIVEAPDTSVGMYNEGTDSLRLTGVSEGAPFSWADAFVQPQSQFADPGGFAGSLNDDISSVLADWINGQPPGTDMFGMDFSQ